MMTTKNVISALILMLSILLIGNLSYATSAELMSRTSVGEIIGIARANKEYDINVIKTITLLSDNHVPADTVNSWDVSNANDGTVMAWLKKNSVENEVQMYDLYIGGNGKIIAPTNSGYLFANYENCTQINGMGNLDTSNANSMRYMFSKCSSLSSIDLSNFDTSQVTIMQYMFNKCSSLQSINLSSFDTSQANNMEYMFYECSSLQSLDLSSFNTSQVTNMRYMFDRCSSLQSLDLTNFDTSKVTDMKYMFFICNNLKVMINRKKIASPTEAMKLLKDCGVSENTVYCVADETSKKSYELAENYGEIFGASRIIVYEDFINGRYPLLMSRNLETTIIGMKRSNQTYDINSVKTITLLNDNHVPDDIVDS